jgi:hypothetical protein
MTNGIAKFEPTNLPPILSAPPAIAFLERRRMGRTNGQVILTEGTRLAPSERRQAEEYLMRVKSSLHSSASDHRITDLVVMLLTAYRTSSRIDVDDDTLKLAAFLAALRGYPLWAIEAAMVACLKGEHVDGRGAGFAPSPPQVVAQVKKAMDPAEREVRRVEEALSAKPYEWLRDGPNRQRASAEHRAAVVERLKGDDHFGLSTPEDKERLEQEKEAHRAQIRRGNELARQKDFERSGQTYIPGYPAPSPTLRALLKEQQKAAEAAR